MIMIVDTSVILAVVLNEPTKTALIQLTTGAELVAPASLHWEIGNALSALLKRKRLKLDEAHQALLEYNKIPIRFLDVALEDAVAIAAQFAIYAYDAYFVACARAQSATILTLDQGRKVAARTAGLTVLEVVP
ncbi:MAG: type II toxin-antitoxin system VapC family toxin [Chloroflexi bacterium]|nr:type II toxin-antitoxin system VapC family toxin [Chloroflexota bacterium]